MELLKEILPKVRTAGALYNSNDPGSPVHFRSAQAAARVLKIELTALEVRGDEDFASALATARQMPIEGLVTFTDPVTFLGWPHVAEFAAREHVVTICEFEQLTRAGCLLSYGPSFDEITQRVLVQMERILKGAKPADLPMEQAARFYLTVNSKAAKALGVTFPPSVLVRVDKTIE